MGSDPFHGRIEEEEGSDPCCVGDEKKKGSDPCPVGDEEKKGSDPCCGGEPGQVGNAALGDRNDEEFGRVVGVKLPDSGFEGREARGGRLDQKLPLVGAFDRALPPIDRAHWREDADARRQLFLHQLLRKRLDVAIGRQRRQRDHELISGHP